MQRLLNADAELLGLFVGLLVAGLAAQVTQAACRLGRAGKQ
jgi:hypothetical protein